MTGLLRWLRPLAFLTAVVALAASAIGVLEIRSEVENVRTAQTENLLWAAAQYQIEYLRFINALEAFSGGDPAISPENVNLRFDVLWSRVSVLQNGSVGTAVSQMPMAMAAVDHLRVALEEVEPLVVGLAPGDTQTAGRILQRFAPLAEEVRLVTREMLNAQTALERVQYQALVRGSGLLTLLVFVTALATLLLVAIYAADARRERQEAQRTARLLEAARQGAVARNRFLSMMSHELRTPMNGILGMIALARQPGLPEGQDQLLAEASKSAKDMHGVLSDLLDLASQDATQDILRVDGLDDLSKRLAAEFDPRQMSVTVTGGPETTAFGLDIRRLTAFLRRVAGPDNALEMSLERRGDQLMMRAASDAFDRLHGAEPASGSAPASALGGQGIDGSLARAALDLLQGRTRVVDGEVVVEIPLAPAPKQ